ALTSCGFTAPTGMKFSMWNTQADGLGVPYTNGQSVSNLTTTNNAAIQLYAQWVDKATHNIIYNNIKTADNGLNPLTFGESQNVTLNNISLVGWIFDGWFTEEIGGSQVTGWNAGAKTSDVTVYAHWTADTVNYTVKKYFQTVSGDGYEQNLSLYPNQTKVGTTETSSNAEAEDNVTGFDLQPIEQQTIANDGSTVVSVYYNRKTITYTFNANGEQWSDGTTANKSVSGLYGAVVNQPTLIKTGWTFVWNESVPSMYGSVSNIFTAQWTPNTYTVVFDANGGTGEMSNMSMTYDVSANLMANVFTLSGHTWLGWSTDPNVAFISEYNDEQAVSNLTAVQGNTVTLYAVWNTIVGDIAYSDGTFSTVYNASKTPIGVVFYTDIDGTSGKFIHLSELSGLAWCLDTADGFDTATSISDGSNNWQIICDAVSDEDVVGNYPAFEYVNSLGDGWYLPAKDELNQIYTNKNLINNVISTLNSVGVSVTLLEAIYWSSSTVDGYNNWVWLRNLGNGNQALYKCKDEQKSVRAVRAF
ncbi:MAG: InlB B-repeat-containing protein, partial [Spirochaetales bacterium]|nr:InlB B-repeat-containing protein [Spirochaetales bacterium]